jgi:hypothetical protein
MPRTHDELVDIAVRWSAGVTLSVDCKTLKRASDALEADILQWRKVRNAMQQFDGKRPGSGLRELRAWRDETHKLITESSHSHRTPAQSIAGTVCKELQRRVRAAILH